jgi:Tfp pilus assembly protein PilN
MNDINLLNDFYRPQKTVKIAAIIAGMVVAVALFVYFGVFGLLQKKNELAVMALKYGQDDAEYESIENEYIELQELVKDLEKKAHSIDPIISRRSLSGIFDLIEDVLPVDVFLSGFYYDGNVIVLQGNAQSDVDIAIFMVNLNESGVFSKVHVQTISGDDGSQNFNMRCALNFVQDIINANSDRER